jgi:hypothetical protein
MLDGLLAYTLGAEACNHDTVGAPERGASGSFARFQGVAFWQLR